MDKSKLLIVWVYYPAVGHVVEAIEVAANYSAANPNLEIHVLLNQESPIAIGEYCDFIEKIHTIDTKTEVVDENLLKELTQIGFDYVVFPKRFQYSPQDFPNTLLKINISLQQSLKPKKWGGYNDTASFDKYALLEKPNSSFLIKVPQEKISFIIPDNAGFPVFSVLLKGASRQTIWPSFRVWRDIFLSIKQKYPAAVFCVTGISSAHGGKINKLEGKKKLDDFIKSIPNAVNCYDVGLDNQLGIIQHSHILLAPHTGFAFLAPCLGTPWLALSGGSWAEHMPARMPFYNVLPSCSHYPCSGDMKLECRLRLKLKTPIKCMYSLNQKTDDLLQGIEKLLNKNYSFEESFFDYEISARTNKVNVEKIWRIKAFKSIN